MSHYRNRHRSAVTLSVQPGPIGRDLNHARRLKSGLARVAREPLVHFLVVGILVCAGVEYRETVNQRFTIHIDDAERNHLAAKYLQQYGERPSDAELESLVAAHVREEMFVREAVALHLDADDEIIRRRLAQKYEFLQTDLGVPAPPDSDTLARWYAAHTQAYVRPPRVAFSQVYFAVDTAHPEDAQRRANAVMTRLRSTRLARAPELGDAFPGPAEVRDLTPDDAARLFGTSELSEALSSAPLGQWSGPFRSGYGWHLIFLTERLPAYLPPLADRREQVIADYLDDARNKAAATQLEVLRAKYRVVEGRDGS